MPPGIGKRQCRVRRGSRGDESLPGRGGRCRRMIVGARCASTRQQRKEECDGLTHVPPPPSAIPADADFPSRPRSEEHTSELQSLMRISYAVFCLKTKTTPNQLTYSSPQTDTTA